MQRRRGELTVSIGRKEQRRIFYEQKIKLIFIGYIVVTVVLALFLFGNVVIKSFAPEQSQGVREQFLRFSPTVQFLVFYIWTIYGYFLAYVYAITKINGIIFRMARIFDEVAEGREPELTFRKNDPFHPVAQSFNRMLDKIQARPPIREELQRIAEAPDDRLRAEINERLSRL
jgi:hypothetical protein